MIRGTLWILILAIFIQYLHGQFSVPRLSRYGPDRATKLRADQPPPPDSEEYPDVDVVHPFTSEVIKRRPFGNITRLHPCDQSSCYPATGDLLIGREKQLYASSTCGLHGRQRYCIVSHLEERKKCFWCDSRPITGNDPSLNHNISNIVSGSNHGKVSWWQSENGKENVYIELDLEAEFHFTHLIITFKSFRPAAMLIERSSNSKKTWQVYRYFAHNCAESFPGIRQGYPANLTDVVCESRYSDVAPSTSGEIIFRVLPPSMHIDNPYSEEVQNLLKITNLRINFTKLHTLGDDLLDRREEIQEKYYYAIYNMVVRGSCSCYGHANRCLPLPGIEPKADMVHGRCECTHNTKGRNCEKCEDFFNDLPWRPAIGTQTNACKRCNCNNHATSCHHDSALYEATGRISGGVCDGCLHNTMGPNCEQCIPFYYQDPRKDIQDPEVCRPCDCDPRGTPDKGICDSVTDPANNLVAGTCHCKRNVQGRRCDECKNGYWNFTESNPDGCQNCTCNTLGTIDNQGCDVFTGECTCKRYVTGRNCQQCLPQYWGLSEKRDGCQPCECDPGGSYDNFCDVLTGQCKCREHMTGRDCSIPKQQHYTASLDFLIYEAELARTSPNCQVVIREPHRDGSRQSWTGTGFVKAFENSNIEFLINDIKTSMDYEIVIRYEPTMSEDWKEVVVYLERASPVNASGPCRDARDDVRHTELPSNSRSVIVHPPVCLDAGHIYKVRLSFRRSNYEKETPTASVLIDSIVLVPRIESIPWLNGSAPGENRMEELLHNGCDVYSYINQNGNVPEVCKKVYSSIGAYIHGGAYLCQCDPDGSVSKFCSQYGGECTCRPNIVGRKCDRCAPGTYGFGPEGCKSCDCNSIGSLDNFCNVTTGQCKCRANTYGRECNECRTGFWNFPNCQRCDCNGHAEKCNPLTGACENCKDNTTGHNCEQCIDGYFGDPKLNVDIPCRPCPCPGVVGSNHSFADRCSLDPYTRDVICECYEGYAGSRCDVCADNYYGNPEEPNGLCRSCECNGKIDELRPGNCDPHTGKCLQCLYDTTGDHCEICRPGYFRYDDDKMCEECVCHPLGTNQTAGPCDPSSGQCPCLPNVIGLKCDKCIANHWKIASLEGCEPCSCDPQGSYSQQCNEYDGQCECKPQFGGRQCNECIARSWGDPKVECKPCQCDSRGSRTMQCDMRTGACKCLPGIGGYNCDRCDRGYLGRAPDCIPCGECFNNWDRILEESKNKTIDIISRAKDIKKVGATGAYSKEFDDMQFQLAEIERLLNNIEAINIEEIKQELDTLKSKFNETLPDTLDSILGNTKEKKILVNIKLQSIKDRIEQLKNKTRDLKNNGTQLQEANVMGALTSIQNAKEKADQAAHKAEHTEFTLNYAERQCKATETYINNTAESFNQQLQNNENKLNEIHDKIKNLENVIPSLNNLICDGNGDPCDEVCGGAGCATCGASISCENGAKQLAENALNVANDTETALRNKETLANDFIRNVSQINTNDTRNLAQMAYDKAKNILIKANKTLNSANKLQYEIKEFLSQNNTKPDDIYKLAEDVLKQKIRLEPDEITDLAEKIKTAVNSLTRIDPIIEETKDDLRVVNKLKEDAENAKSNSTKILSDAADVNKALENTTNAQDNAEEAITKALQDIIAVEKLLEKIKSQTSRAQNQTNKTSDDIRRLGDQLIQLQGNITDNEIYANRVLNESSNILENAKETYDSFNSLQAKYGKAKTELGKNINKVQSSKERANDLFNRALNLVAKVTKTEEDIQKLHNNGQWDNLFILENKLEDLIRRMNGYNDLIKQRHQYYKLCT